MSSDSASITKYNQLIISLDDVRFIQAFLHNQILEDRTLH